MEVDDLQQEILEDYPTQELGRVEPLVLRVETQGMRASTPRTPRTRNNLRQILVVVDHEAVLAIIVMELAKIVMVRTLEIVLLGDLLPRDSQEQVVQTDLLQVQEEDHQVPVQPVLHDYEAQVAQEAIWRWRERESGRIIVSQ